jgi:hypothetical protein
MREAIRQERHRHPDDFAALEARVPDGCHVAVFCSGRPTIFGASLVRDHAELARVPAEYHSVIAAVSVVLHKAAQEAAA